MEKIKIGQKIGKLIVLSREQKGKIYHCVCECGIAVTHWGSSLTAGKNRPCPCFVSPTKGNIKHLKGKTSEYKAWAEMKQRCYNKNNARYPWYGARGILVCDKWLNSFEAFFADMGIKPSKKHSLDRIDNNRNYEPSNCRWSNDKTQTNNTRRNVKITHNGETKTLAQWAELYNVGYHRLRDRLSRNWPFEKAVLYPILTKHYPKNITQ
jgi:hypothetical protein